jgi:hypothetical protein
MTEYLSSFDYELIADALDILDPDGSEATRRKQELEAWARSMAATGRGYLPPAVPGETSPPIRVLVALEGGCVSAVTASVAGVQLVTIDYDTEGADEAELFDIPQDGEGTVEAFRHVGECDHDTSGFWEGARDARPTAPVERLAMLRRDQEGGEGAYFDAVRREADELEAWLARDDLQLTETRGDPLPSPAV